MSPPGPPPDWEEFRRAMRDLEIRVAHLEARLGELLGAFALTEPASGSDAASLKTTARRSGNEYILNGTKIFITNLGRAGCYIVFARTGPDERASGVSAFIVAADSPGLRAGQVFKKMGLNGNQLHVGASRGPSA